MDWAHRLLGHGQPLDMVEVLKELRKRRAHAIQETSQFLFAHLCVMELLVQVSNFYEKRKESRMVISRRTTSVSSASPWPTPSTLATRNKSS